MADLTQVHGILKKLVYIFVLTPFLGQTPVKSVFLLQKDWSTGQARELGLHPRPLESHALFYKILM